MKKNLIFLVLALAAPVAFAQDKPAQPAAAAAAPTATAAPAPADPDPVIMTAGDLKVRKSDFEAAIKSLPAEYQSYATGTGKKQFAEDFLRMKLLAGEGVKANLQNDPEVVRQLDLMRENLVATAEVKKLQSGVTVTDEDLKKAYDENKKDYEQVSARHILIAFKGSPAAQGGKKELTEDQARAKAEELRKKIVAGADFAELAKTESDDTGSGSRGGDLGAFGHGQMVPEFEKAAFETKAGEVTPVIRTQFGYHIIKVEKHDSTPFEQVKGTLEKNVREKKLRDAIDAIKDNAKPTFNEAYFAPPPPPPAPAAEKPAASTAPAPAAKKQTAAPKKDAKKP